MKTRILLAIVVSTALAGCGGQPPVAAYDLAAQGVYSGTLSARSELTLVGSLSHGGSLWRTAEHARLFDWNHRPGEFSQLVAGAFSPDGTRAVTSDPRTLVVWDTVSGRSLAYWTTPSAAHDVALSDDGRVLMGLADHSAVLFDAASGRHLQTFLHQGAVRRVALSGDGRWALTGSDDGSAVLWDADSGAAVHRLGRGDPVRVVAVSTQGRYLFTASQRRAAVVWDGSSGERRLRLESRAAITAARFSADERLLLIGYVDRSVELWDLGSAQRLKRWVVGPRRVWQPGSAAVLAVGFSDAPGRFYALAGDGRLLALERG